MQRDRHAKGRLLFAYGFWAVATDFEGSGDELQEVLTVEEDEYIDDHKMGDLSADPNNNDPDFQPAAETVAAKDDVDHAREVEQAGRQHRRDSLHQQGALQSYRKVLRSDPMRLSVRSPRSDIKRPFSSKVCIHNR